jgi:hypothetical protein
LHHAAHEAPELPALSQTAIILIAVSIVAVWRPLLLRNTTALLASIIARAIGARHRSDNTIVMCAMCHVLRCPVSRLSPVGRHVMMSCMAVCAQHGDSCTSANSSRQRPSRPTNNCHPRPPRLLDHKALP